MPTVSEDERRDDLIEEELEEAGLVVAPDGGWGWVVVFGSFMANVIVDGVIFTAGSGFQPEWERDFGASSASAAWTVSLLSGCYLLVGPLVGALANQFGCRTVAIIGTCIASLGFILSQWAPGLPLLYFTFGIMGGVGYGMVYMPAVVIVSFYFHKRRALATGLAVCGSGIGTFLFAPLIRVLLDYYTWQQSMLLIAGISLNCLVCASVFRTLQPSSKQLDKLTEVALKYHDELEKTADMPNGRIISPVTSMDGELHKQPPSPYMAEGQDFEHFHKRTKSYSGRPFKSVLELRVRNHGVSESVDTRGMSQADMYRMVSHEALTELNRPMSRRDVFYTGSVMSLSQRVSRSTAPSILSVATLPIAPDEGGMSHDWKENVLFALRSMLDYTLLKSPSFLILAFGGFLTLCGFFVPFIYLPRHAVQMGHSKGKATFLVSILGMTNICARIFCGWLSDHPKLDALIIHNAAVTMGGVATFFVPFVSSYWLLAGYCVVFGFGTACFAALRSIICVELLGLERLTSAYGFLLLFMGIAALVGSPIAGFLHDLTGDYKLSFCVMGVLMAVSGLIGFPLRAISKWELRRIAEMEYEEQSDEYEEEEEDELPLHSMDAWQEKTRKKLSRVQETLEDEEQEL